MAKTIRSGFIVLQRTEQDNPLWPKRRVFSVFEAWLFLVFHASFRSEEVIIDGLVYPVSCGDVLMSKRELARRWRWSVWKVSRFLSLLEARGEINLNPSNGVLPAPRTGRPFRITTIRIVNFVQFQMRPKQKRHGSFRHTAWPDADPAAAGAQQESEIQRTPNRTPAEQPPHAGSERYNIGISGYHESMPAPALLSPVRQVSEHYCRAIKQEGRKRYLARAAQSIAKLLRDGHTPAQLMAAVDRYARRMPHDPAYRYLITNFFGKSAWYYDYLREQDFPDSAPPGKPHRLDRLTETEKIFLEQREARRNAKQQEEHHV